MALNLLALKEIEMCVMILRNKKAKKCKKN